MSMIIKKKTMSMVNHISAIYSYIIVRMGSAGESHARGPPPVVDSRGGSENKFRGDQMDPKITRASLAPSMAVSRGGQFRGFKILDGMERAKAPGFSLRSGHRGWQILSVSQLATREAPTVQSHLLCENGRGYLLGVPVYPAPASRCLR
jgi:hypothetical protein